MYYDYSQNYNSEGSMKIILIVLAVFLGSCTKEAKVSNDLIVALESSPKTLDPRVATDANGMRVASLLFQSLVGLDNNLQPVGEAAESWEVKGKKIVFKIKEGLKFSNGRLITEDDYLGSIEEFKSDNSPFKSAFSIIESAMYSSDSSGAYLTLSLKSMSLKFLTADLPVFKVLPIKELKENERQFAEAPFGSGSYLLKSINEREINLELNPHSNKKPKLAGLKFLVVKDDFTRFQKVFRGEIHLAQDVLPLDKIKKFSEDKDFKVTEFPGLSFSYLLMNLKSEKFKNKKVREALSLSIDRSSIIKFKLQGYGEKATSIMSPKNAYFKKGLEGVNFDLPEAKKLVAQLSESEKKLSFKVSNNQQVVDIAKVIANQLGKAGFTVDIQSYEWGTFYEDIKKGKYELSMMRWVGAVDPDIYRMAFHSSEHPPGRNRSFYSNSKIDNLLDKGVTELDFNKRKAIYDEVQTSIYNEKLILPLWHNKKVTVMGSKIEGYEPRANGDFNAFVEVSKKVN